eukprot:m.134312 g.134312  ORF g.134312 m.134312 type:complete len:61 (+) comp14691_c0_seq3:949-1131(+)
MEDSCVDVTWEDDGDDDDDGFAATNQSINDFFQKVSPSGETTSPRHVFFKDRGLQLLTDL